MVQRQKKKKVSAQHGLGHISFGPVVVVSGLFNLCVKVLNGQYVISVVVRYKVRQNCNAKLKFKT